MTGSPSLFELLFEGCVGVATVVVTDVASDVAPDVAVGDVLIRLI